MKRKFPYPLLLAATLLAPVGARAADTLPSPDSTFLPMAARGGLLEVQEGQMAQQKSANPQVQQFGAALMQDHTQANDELTRIAQSKGITPPAAPTSAGREQERKLSRVSGTEFDHRFVIDAIRDNKKAITLFQREAKNGGDPQLRGFAEKYLPVLQRHLATAQGLAGKS